MAKLLDKEMRLIVKIYLISVYCINARVEHADLASIMPIVVRPTANVGRMKLAARETIALAKDL